MTFGNNELISVRGLLADSLAAKPFPLISGSERWSNNGIPPGTCHLTVSWNCLYGMLFIDIKVFLGYRTLTGFRTYMCACVRVNELMCACV